MGSSLLWPKTLSVVADGHFMGFADGRDRGVPVWGYAPETPRRTTKGPGVPAVRGLWKNQRPVIVLRKLNGKPTGPSPRAGLRPMSMNLLHLSLVIPWYNGVCGTRGGRSFGGLEINGKGPGR